MRCALTLQAGYFRYSRYYTSSASSGNSSYRPARLGVCNLKGLRFPEFNKSSLKLHHGSKPPSF